MNAPPSRILPFVPFLSRRVILPPLFSRMHAQTPESLNVDSLNLMISDALCMVPRLTRPLTQIVADKTSGSPFFATEFLETLVNRSLLHHSESEGRWLWDEERITSSNITDNVLFLLQVKIGRLHVTIKEALKTASCFGTRIHASAIGYLAQSGGHPSIRAGMEQARREGLLVMASPSHYKFVHDKVRRGRSAGPARHDCLFWRSSPRDVIIFPEICLNPDLPRFPPRARRSRRPASTSSPPTGRARRATISPCSSSPSCRRATRTT